MKKLLLGLFFVTTVSLNAHSMSVDVNCKREISCSNNQVCTGKVSYSLSYKLIAGTIDMFPTQGGIHLEEIDQNGEIIVSGYNASYRLGAIDLSVLNCNSQDRDTKLLPIQDDAGTDLKLKELDSGACRRSHLTSADGEQIWVKRAKYGLKSESSQVLFFHSNYHFVRCSKTVEI